MFFCFFVTTKTKQKQTNIVSGDIGYLSGLIGTSGIKFRHTVASYNYSWHTAPTRQFIVNLDGAVEVEVSNGEKKIIQAGEVFFVEDTSGMYYSVKLRFPRGFSQR